MTLSEIIHLALRKIGAINARATLGTTQQDQALAALRSIFTEARPYWFNVAGEEGYTAGEDERVYCLTAQTIYRPDYMTFDGTAVVTGTTFDDCTMRLPRDGARIQVINQETAERTTYLYRGDVGGWIDVEALTADDECPFSADAEDPIAATLAVRLAPQYSDNLPSPLVIEESQQWTLKKSLRLGARKVKRGVDPVLLRLTRAGRFY